VVNLIDYSDIDKMMDINNEKCYAGMLMQLAIFSAFEIVVFIIPG
jgi:hypothetical protein